MPAGRRFSTAACEIVGHVGGLGRRKAEIRRQRARRDRSAPAPTSHASGKAPQRRRSDDAPRPATAEIVLEQVRRVAKERAAGITLDSSIVELGLDSLERMEIIAALEETVRRAVSRGSADRDRNLPRSGRGRGNISGLRFPRPRAPSKVQPRFRPRTIASTCFPEYVQAAADHGADCGGRLHEPVFQGPRAASAATRPRSTAASWSASPATTMSACRAILACREAAKRAIDRYGTSVSASRLVSGEKTIHRELEQAIAAVHGRRGAIVYVERARAPTKRRWGTCSVRAI